MEAGPLPCIRPASKSLDSSSDHSHFKAFSLCAHQRSPTSEDVDGRRPHKRVKWGEVKTVTNYQMSAPMKCSDIFFHIVGSQDTSKYTLNLATCKPQAFKRFFCLFLFQFWKLPKSCSSTLQPHRRGREHTG